MLDTTTDDFFVESNFAEINFQKGLNIEDFIKRDYFQDKSILDIARFAFITFIADVKLDYNYYKNNLEKNLNRPSVDRWYAFVYGFLKTKSTQERKKWTALLTDSYAVYQNWDTSTVAEQKKVNFYTILFKEYDVMKKAQIKAAKKAKNKAAEKTKETQEVQEAKEEAKEEAIETIEEEETRQINEQEEIERETDQVAGLLKELENINNNDSTVTGEDIEFPTLLSDDDDDEKVEEKDATKNATNQVEEEVQEKDATKNAPNQNDFTGNMDIDDINDDFDFGGIDDDRNMRKRARWVDPNSDNPCIFSESVEKKDFLTFAKTFQREFKAKKKIDLLNRDCMAKMYLIGVKSIQEQSGDLLRTYNLYENSEKNLQPVRNYVDDIFDMTSDYFRKKSDQIGKMLKSFKNVQWAYYRRPSDPRIKHVYQQWERLDTFFNKSKLIMDATDKNGSIPYFDIISELIPSKTIGKHRDFLFDSREKFLYKSKRNGVVKYSVLLNNSICKEDGCDNYEVMGVKLCFIHLLKRNLKIKPSHISPGKLGIFAWLPPKDRTVEKLAKPIFFGPPDTNTDYNAAGPLKERSYGYNFDLESPQVPINPETTPASRFTAMTNKSILDFDSEPFLDTKFDEELVESNEYIPQSKKEFYFGTPLIYIHPQAPGIILEDNITDKFSPRTFFESKKRSFAYVTARQKEQTINIYALENIYHGQELVFLPTSKFLLNKEQLKQSLVIHRTVKKNDFSLPITPMQIQRRINKLKEFNPNITSNTVIDIGNLKKITFKKRKFIQMNAIPPAVLSNM